MIYKGQRTTSGEWEIRVYTDEHDSKGTPLEPIPIHSPSGYSWGYSGSGPADAAIAILAHHFEERRSTVMEYWNRKLGQRCKVSQAIRSHQFLKDSSIARWSQALGGQVTTEEIERILADHPFKEEGSPL